MMTTAMVEARGVRKNFGVIEILKGIDLRVEKGSVTCLIGPSGSGKTTFLRCINHLEKVDAGRLYVDEHLVGYTERNGKLYEMKERQTARSRLNAGMVFQRFNLFPHMTVLENIIEAPVHVLVSPAVKWWWRRRCCWTGWAWATAATPTRRSFPAVSSSASRSPGHWP